MQQEQLDELITEMAQCALIALGIEQQTGKCGFGNMSEHNFLKKWLSIAYKQKRFSKEIAPALSTLIELTKKRGQLSELKANLTKLSIPGIVDTPESTVTN